MSEIKPSQSAAGPVPHVESVDPGYMETDEQRIAGKLRERGFWGTHADRWNDKEWQESYWKDLAGAVLELPEGVIARLDVTENGVRTNLKERMPVATFVALLRELADAFENGTIERVEES